MNQTDLMSPSKVAEKYGGDKQKIARAAQLGIIDPTVAVMAGMFIDRMRGAAAEEQAPRTTVAQDIMAGQEQGLGSLPIPDNMYGGEEGFAGGGIVAFAGNDEDVGSFVDMASIREGKRKSPFEDMVIQRAIANGEDPRSALEILYRETGAIKNAERAISPKGATGIMQIMPKTAMDPGYGMANIFDMAESQGIPVADRSEGTAKELLKNPGLNAAFGVQYRSAMEKKFGNPQLAAAAYNAGPGAVERAGGIPDIAETKKYVAGISPERFEAASQSVRAARREQMGLPPDVPAAPAERAPLNLGSTFDPYLEATRLNEREAPPTIPGAAAAIDQVTKITKAGVQQEKAQQAAAAEAAKQAPATAATAAIRESLKGAEENKPESIKARYERLLAEREGRLASQREQDKNLAILAAGLGIMGGKSQYAAQNIGAGALKGIEQYGAARKQTGKEEEDILAGRLGQYKIEEAGAAQQESKYLQLMANARRAAMDNIIKARKLDITAMDQNSLANLEREADALLSRDPAYQAMYKKIYGAAYEPGPLSSPSIDYGKMYGLTPKKS